jgi:hypothetical protein
MVQAGKTNFSYKNVFNGRKTRHPCWYDYAQHPLKPNEPLLRPFLSRIFLERAASAGSQTFCGTLKPIAPA